MKPVGRPESFPISGKQLVRNLCGLSRYSRCRDKFREFLRHGLESQAPSRGHGRSNMLKVCALLDLRWSDEQRPSAETVLRRLEAITTILESEYDPLATWFNDWWNLRLAEERGRSAQKRWRKGRTPKNRSQ
jgi:hypothetical protein